ncbi:glycosyl hydrolase family 18 protein [Brevibacillus laterosporus]|uniref:chitinase n=1 Tax=Brevibacillus laterosporus TaxID=1465 RepID=A0AAP8U7E1_BRELA|nr:glycosyl hydrolase family 18 protein [Brevibacillus laterosporus]MED1666516.1 glycosyl hydrolase family 18 protein [Brevibacillus laterosporus]MED1669827.1 glycosyl hydrolase family 18 protein [Brevibacillus laterosporus]MED1720323.1 glycosyl hydrolase family 18 protein [Brevibacillus laterosporus]PPA89300.1 chitinase [Brevibacillus laterosporus]PPB13170.1 chitinase [Brevibacillus laterosporus]
MKRFFSWLSTLLVLVAMLVPNTSFAEDRSNSSTSDSKTAASPYNKRIVAYYPEWGIYAGHNNYTPAKIPWGKITHLNYAFADINMATGTIDYFDKYAATEALMDGATWGSPDAGTLGSIRKHKKQYPHVKTMISIGGWSRSAGFHDVAKTPEARAKFSKSVVDFIRQWQFDGADIDWEYPGFKRDPDKVDNPNDLGTPKADDTEKQTFTLLLKDLRKALTKAGQEDGKYYELTAAVGCGLDKIAKTEPDKYAQYLDFINVMTYDIHGAWENKTGHHSPLFPNPKEPYEELVKVNYNTAQALKNFEKYGIPKDKLIVGSPFYSRGWGQVKNDGPIPELPGLFASTVPESVKGIWDGGRNAGNNPYYHVKDVLEKDSSFKKYYDPVSKAPYIYSESKQQMFTYEDPTSLQEKVNFVNQNGYGGIIVWEVTGDPKEELISVIANGFKSGTTPTEYGAISLEVANQSYTFTPEITFNGAAYSVAFGQKKLVDQVPTGTYAITAKPFEDTTYKYSPIVKPATVQVAKGQTHTVTIEYKQEPKGPTEPDPNKIQAKVDFQVTSQWDTGYNFTLVITNTGKTPISNWTLQFDYSGQLTSVWDATLTPGQNSYQVKPPSWATEIAPGKSLTLSGAGSGKASVPTNYKINGSPITGISTVAFGELIKERQ